MASEVLPGSGAMCAYRSGNESSDLSDKTYPEVKLRQSYTPFVAPSAVTWTQFSASVRNNMVTISLGG